MTRRLGRQRAVRLGVAVRTARERLGVSRTELAVAAKVSVGYVGTVETDLRIPSAVVLTRIATRLQLDPDELLALAGRLSDDVELLIEKDKTALAVLKAMVTLRPQERRQVLAFAEALEGGREKRSRRP